MARKKAPKIDDVLNFLYEAMRDGDLDAKSRLRAAELLGKKLELAPDLTKDPDQLIIRLDYGKDAAEGDACGD